MADRPRRQGEDVISYALETNRFSASRAQFWRAEIAAGRATESHVEALFPLPDDIIRAAAAAADDEVYASLFAGGSGRSVAAAAYPDPGLATGTPTDPLSINPLADELRARNPAVYRAAVADGGPPPDLFESGPLPPFTASNMDVRILARLPWQARHAAATAPTLALALQIVEETQGNPDALALSDEYASHPGNESYRSRFRMWALGNPAPSTSSWA